MSSAKSVQRKLWTLQDIVKANKAVGGHYFDAKTLGFFGQSLKDFTVHQAGERVFVFAVSHHGWDADVCSLGEFNPSTGRVDHPNDAPLTMTPKQANAYLDTREDAQEAGRDFAKALKGTLASMYNVPMP